ncbi:MAG TPA: hypothetical protein VKA65_05335, partial [Acidimicrobiales bacterium]|nr:hypothetical protein [Acidimicrobiales bacterium]
PPATMLAALVGGAAAGVPGALLATPLIAASKAVWLDSRGVPAPTDGGERIRTRVDRTLARWRRSSAPAAEREKEKDEDAERAS